MSVYNHRKVTEYWLTRINNEHAEHADAIAAFIQALRLHGIREVRVKDYAQFSLRIIEIYDNACRDWTTNSRSNNSSSNNSNSNGDHRPVSRWSREYVDRIASVIVSNRN